MSSSYSYCIMTIKCFEDNTSNYIKLPGGQTDHADSFSSSESIILIALYFECCAITSPNNPFQGPLCTLQAIEGVRGRNKNLFLKINCQVYRGFSAEDFSLILMGSFWRKMCTCSVQKAPAPLNMPQYFSSVDRKRIIRIQLAFEMTCLFLDHGRVLFLHIHIYIFYKYVFIFFCF